MRIEIHKLNNFNENELHLKISTPDGNSYNFRVPKASNGVEDEYTFIYPYESMRALHELLDKFINHKLKSSNWNNQT